MGTNKNTIFFRTFRLSILYQDSSYIITPNPDNLSEDRVKLGKNYGYLSNKEKIILETKKLVVLTPRGSMSEFESNGFHF